MAREIAPLIAAAIERIEAALNLGAGFDPTTSLATSTAGMGEYAEIALVGGLAEAFSREAPIIERSNTHQPDSAWARNPLCRRLRDGLRERTIAPPISISIAAAPASARCSAITGTKSGTGMPASANAADRNSRRQA